MDDVINTIAGHWNKMPGATVEQVAQMELAVGIRLPDDYKTFLFWSNGGEGTIGSWYFSLWSTNEVGKLNKDYKTALYIPGVLGIGTDGGSKCYALDYRNNLDHPSLVKVPLGDLDFTSIVVLGETFRAGIKKAIDS